MAERSFPTQNPLIVVLGATGTGKSQLAIDLATRFNGEVINGDAMQMYDGLPIITNKVTVQERNGIPHHLLGFISHDEEPWRVGIFKRNAGRIIKEIRSRNRLPILVGGTHYYTQSLLFEDSLVAEQEAQMEADVAPELSTQEIENKFPILIGSTDTMLQKLKEVDPIMADRWHPNDRRKIRRSLEIFLLTGRKASEVYGLQKENRFLRQNTTLLADKELSPESKQLKSTLLFWVYSEPEVLKKRLDNRVDKMMDSGLLAEVKSMNVFLQAKLKDEVEVDQGRGIWVSIGWKEFVPYLAALESGSESPNHVEELLSQSIERVKSATRQYAQRQNRWIRRKLIAALSEQNSLNSLYLLDGTNQDDWSDSVLKPALELTESFLTGQQLQKPSEMSSSAKRLLNPELPNESPDPSTRRECDLCHTIVVTEEQWQSHLKSRTHRRIVKKGKIGMAHERPAPGDGNDSATVGSN